MTDAEKREKVIRGLERCAGTDCTGCPYQGISPCQNKLAADALALLKEQNEEIKCLRARVRLNAEFGLQEPLEEIKDEEKH